MGGGEVLQLGVKTSDGNCGLITIAYNVFGVRPLYVIFCAESELSIEGLIACPFNVKV
jgi:hypothetical protein